MANNDYPLVSVIIPVYNAGKYVEETINNVLSQTYPAIEIILVDDGSTDNSLQIIKKYESEKIRVYSQKNKGAAAARNHGIHMSQGLFIQHLDADDLLAENKIAAQMDVFKKKNYDHRLVVASPMILFQNHISDIEKTPRNWDIYKDYASGKDCLIDMIQLGQYFYIHTYLLHKDLIHEVGAWEESFSTNDDGVFFAKILLSANSVIFCKDTLVYYRNTPNSLSKLKSDKYYDSHIRSMKFIIENLLKQDSSPEITKICFDYYVTESLSYLDKSKYLKKVIADMEDLNLIKYKRKSTPLFNILQDILGFKNAMYILSYCVSLKRKFINTKLIKP